jgi:hypothetical protein
MSREGACERARDRSEAEVPLESYAEELER